MKTLDLPRLARFATLVCALAIAWLSLKPQGEPPEAGFPVFVFLAELILGDAQQTDKIKHALAYFALMGAAFVGFRKRIPSLRIIGGTLAYGLLFEGLQSLTPDRTASLADMAANSVGVAIGLSAGYVATKVVPGVR
ncbi:MAG: VanZ family protein [Pseudomonadota bacterium]